MDHRLLFLLVPFFAACSLFNFQGSESPESSAEAPSAHVVLPELHLDGDRLHATIWYEHMPGAFRAVLRGPGFEEGIDVQAAGSGSCSRLRFIERSPSYDANSRCSWSVPAPSEGTWSIDVVLAGEVIQTANFRMLETAAIGGGRTWIVHPADRTGVTYVHPAGFVTWVAVDLRTQLREYAWVVLNGSQHIVQSDSLTRTLREGEPAIQVLPLVAPKSPSANEHTIVLLTEGSRDAWAYSVDRSADPDTVQGLSVWRRSEPAPGEWMRFFGQVEATALSAEDAAKAVELAGSLRFEARAEGSACALLASPERLRLISERRSAEESMRASGRRAGEAERQLSPRLVVNHSRDERRSLESTRRAALDAEAEHRAERERLDAAIEALDGQFEAGCLPPMPE